MRVWGLVLLMSACATGVRKNAAAIDALTVRQKELEKTLDEMREKVVLLEGRADFSRSPEVQTPSPVVLPKPEAPLKPKSFMGVGEGPAETDAGIRLTNEDLAAFTRRRELEITNAYAAAERPCDKRDLPACVDAMNAFVAKYPDHPKAPEALMKIGATCKELGKMGKAKENFSQTVRKYPRSEAARRAKQELDNLQGEGKGP